MLHFSSLVEFEARYLDLEVHTMQRVNLQIIPNVEC